MTPAERLIRRLRTEHPELRVPEDARLQRIGRNRTSGLGRWSWYLLDGNGYELKIGSHWPVHALLACRGWWVVEPIFDDRTIDPAPGPDYDIALARIAARATASY